MTPIGGRARPEWWINTGNRERRCYLACHGEVMDGNGSLGVEARYRPAAARDDNPIIP